MMPATIAEPARERFCTAEEYVSGPLRNTPQSTGMAAKSYFDGTSVAAVGISQPVEIEYFLNSKSMSAEFEDVSVPGPLSLVLKLRTVLNLALTHRSLSPPIYHFSAQYPFVASCSR